MEMSDKEFKQRMVLALAQNQTINSLTEEANRRKCKVSDVLVNVANNACKMLNELDEPNQ